MRGRFVRALGAIAAVSLSLVAVPAAPASAAPAAMPRTNAHGMRRTTLATPSSQSQVQSTVPPHLRWYGGPVLQHVKVVEVVYGDGTYLPQVTGDAAPNIPSFFSQVTNSSYFDWLSEYSAGNRWIQRGSFVDRYTITPSFENDGASCTIAGVNTSCIDDTDISAELTAQVNASTLPAPDADTLYFVFFPQSKTITAGTDNSVDNFCAYHSTVPFSGSQNLRYAVMPYASNDEGCGPSVGIGNTESVASHELTEAVTDPDVGLATQTAAPLAWYDLHYGEISDICNGQQGTLTGTDTFHYKVQLNWSNQNNICEMAGAARTISVGDASVVEGDTFSRYLSFPVTLSSPSNATQTVNYTLQGSPSNGTTATAGVDFTMASGTVTFPAVKGRTPSVAYISVPVKGDTTVEGTEQFRVVLRNPSPGYAISRSTGFGTIIRDDPVAFKYSAISIGDTTVYVGDHGDRELMFPVTLSRPWLGALPVRWQITGGDAQLNHDFFGATSGMVLIPAGGMGAPIRIPIHAHTVSGSPKTILVTLSQVPGYPLPQGIGINRARGTGTLKAG
jgi:hypothetical protein